MLKALETLLTLHRQRGTRAYLSAAAGDVGAAAVLSVVDHVVVRGGGGG